MDLNRLSIILAEAGEPPFRFKQICKSYFSGKYSSFDDLTDISKPLRSLLQSQLSYYSVTEDKVLKDGNTIKSRLKLADGSLIESVLMDYGDWLTVCVSSQVGCPLGCKFCATGKMGFKRNLSVEEIIDQILYWNHYLYPKYVGRVVFMGMGEPFLNWDNLLAALKIVNSPTGLNIGARKISVSTAGIVPKIKEFALLDTEINLAISLHAPSQKIRETIMPVSRTYAFDDLIDTCRFYTKNSRRQLFFEYALIAGTNDSPESAHVLSRLINSDRLFYLNLIPLNQVKDGLTPAGNDSLDKFCRILEDNHVNFSVRHSFGQSINSACGQLIVDSAGISA